MYEFLEKSLWRDEILRQYTEKKSEHSIKAYKKQKTIIAAEKTIISCN